MDYQLLLSNLTNPILLFFALGCFAVVVKSDLEIPESTSKFLSLYLLFSIGFKGGQELAYSGLNTTILWSLGFGIFLSTLIPIYSFYLLKRKFSISDSAALAATYGSVSAVTFVAAVSFLEAQNIAYGGHMVAVMALMESPAIIMGVLLLSKYDKDSSHNKLSTTLRHSFTNASVLIIMGSLLIGYISDAKQAEGIKPFTTDIFKGFLAIFLLEMGMVTARRFKAFRNASLHATLFALAMPLFNGCIVALISGLIVEELGNRFLFAILAASASYIAVPAAMRIAAPKADPGLYVPMALGLTFPFNISLGMPLYFIIIKHTFT